MKTRNYLVASFLMLTVSSFAQNITGVWEGNTGGEYCKIVILQMNDSCFGYTYDTGLGYCKANFVGTYKEDTKRLVGKNTSFIERTGGHVLSSYILSYSQSNGIEYLKGFILPKSAFAKILSLGVSYPVTYRKISEKVDTSLLMPPKTIFHKPDTAKVIHEEKPVVINPAPVKDSPVIKVVTPAVVLKTIKESRKSTLVQTITTTADTIKLVLYDNGEIDGDTVTVFDNGKMIVEKLRLGVKGFEVLIPLNKNNNFHAIELMANNLGSIPPNTAYMLILAGKERYELRLTSDFSVNAQVNIQLKTGN